MRMSVSVGGADAGAHEPIDVTSGVVTDVRAVHCAKAAADSRARKHSE